MEQREDEGSFIWWPLHQSRGQSHLAGRGGDRRQRLKEMVSNSYSGGFGREPAGDESVHRRDFGVSGTHLPRPA